MSQRSIELLEAEREKLEHSQAAARKEIDFCLRIIEQKKADIFKWDKQISELQDDIATLSND